MLLKEEESVMESNEADNSVPGPNPKSAARLSPGPPPSSPSPKRRIYSRRSIQKRVVSVPIPEAAGEGSRAKGVGECSPPSDSWAWRKYGQKPIKGSPYPRGYYRCSSSKGCPARKQVERSRVDPTMLVVTYTCEHNHSWPVPKTHHHHHSTKHATVAAAAVKAEAEIEAEGTDPDPDPMGDSPQAEISGGADPEESRFSDLLMMGEEEIAGGPPMMMMMPDDFWYSDVGSTSSTSPPADALLYGPIFAAAAAAEESDKIGDFNDDDDDSLFAGLGELPEYSTVFRRSYLERQLPVHTAVHQ